MAVLSHSPCSLIYPSCHLSIYPSIHHGVKESCHHPWCSSISTTFHHLSLIYPSRCSIMFHPLIVMFHHVPPIDLGVPSCSIHPLIVMFQPTAANSAESLDSLPHSDCESLQPELEEVKPEVRTDDYKYL